MGGLDDEFNNLELKRKLSNIIYFQDNRIGGVITSLMKNLEERKEAVRDLNSYFKRNLISVLFDEYGKVCSPAKTILLLLDAQEFGKLEEVEDAFRNAIFEDVSLEIDELYKIVRESDEMPISTAVILGGIPKEEEEKPVIPSRNTGLNLEAMRNFK